MTRAARGPRRPANRQAPRSPASSRPAARLRVGATLVPGPGPSWESPGSFGMGSRSSRSTPRHRRWWRPSFRPAGAAPCRAGRTAHGRDGAGELGADDRPCVRARAECASARRVRCRAGRSCPPPTSPRDGSRSSGRWRRTARARCCPMAGRSRSSTAARHRQRASPRWSVRPASASASPADHRALRWHPCGAGPRQGVDSRGGAGTPGSDDACCRAQPVRRRPIGPSRRPAPGGPGPALGRLAGREVGRGGSSVAPNGPPSDMPAVDGRTTLVPLVAEHAPERERAAYTPARSTEHEPRRRAPPS